MLLISLFIIGVNFLHILVCQNLQDTSEFTKCIANNNDCITFCQLKLHNLIDEEGNYNLTNRSPNYSNVINNCAREITESSVCLKVKQMEKCVNHFLNPIEKECCEITHTNYKELADTIEDYEKHACYYRCIFIKHAAINERNEFIERDSEIVRVCEDKHKEEDLCLQAVKRLKCISSGNVQ